MKKLAGIVTGLVLIACTIIAIIVLFNTNTSNNIISNNTSVLTSSNDTTPDIIISTTANNSGMELSEPLPLLATSLMIYELDNTGLTAEYKSRIANIFYMTITDMDENVIRNQNGDLLNFYKTGGFYFRTSDCYDNAKPDNLPGEEEAIEIAKNFLKTNNLMPDYVRYVGAINDEVGKYDPVNGTSDSYPVAWVVGFTRTINNITLYGNGEKLTLSIGDDGKITSVQVVCRNVTSYQTKKLKSTEQAYSELIHGNNSSIFSTTTGVKKAKITNVTLCYYVGHGDRYQQYLEPYYVFTGDAITNGETTKDAYKALVKAV